MSERDTTEYEERVSPYLLRPARTYEEYLRDCEAAGQESEEHKRSATGRRGGDRSTVSGTSD